MQPRSKHAPKMVLAQKGGLLKPIRRHESGWGVLFSGKYGDGRWGRNSPSIFSIFFPGAAILAMGAYGISGRGGGNGGENGRAKAGKSVKGIKTGKKFSFFFLFLVLAPQLLLSGPLPPARSQSSLPRQEGPLARWYLFPPSVVAGGAVRGHRNPPPGKIPPGGPGPCYPGGPSSFPLFQWGGSHFLLFLWGIRGLISGAHLPAGMALGPPLSFPKMFRNRPPLFWWFFLLWGISGFFGFLGVFGAPGGANRYIPQISPKMGFWKKGALPPPPAPPASQKGAPAGPRGGGWGGNLGPSSTLAGPLPGGPGGPGVRHPNGVAPSVAAQEKGQDRGPL